MLTGFPEGLLLSFNVKPRVLTAFTSEVVESFVFAFVGLVYVLWVLCPGFLWLRFGLGFYAFASGCVCVCVVLCVFYRFYVFYGRFYVFAYECFMRVFSYECLKPRFMSVLYSAFFLSIYLNIFLSFFFFYFYFFIKKNKRYIYLNKS